MNYYNEPGEKSIYCSQTDEKGWPVLDGFQNTQWDKRYIKKVIDIVYTAAKRTKATFRGRK
jgi:hypothetical protein